MSSSALLYAILAGVLPAFVWLAFWLREDIDRPEPRFLLAGSFLAGSLSVIIAIFTEKYISDVVNNENLRYALWAAAEEIIKFAVVFFVALRSKWNDEPIDAMIYMITVALGFAAIENALFILGPLSNGAIAESIATGGMRFIGATLVHVVSSALIGFTLGLAFYKGRLIKFIAAIVGLTMAIALHASFNLTIINSHSTDILQTFIWVWVAVIILIILFEEVKVVKPKLL